MFVYVIYRGSVPYLLPYLGATNTVRYSGDVFLQRGSLSVILIFWYDCSQTGDYRDARALIVQGLYHILL